MGDDEAELGLGIHGEPGVERIDLAAVSAIVATMAGRLAATLPPGEADHALILNNLGSVPPIEMGVVAREVLRSALGRRVRLVLGPGPFMTALNMNGFSLSLLRLDDAREAALAAPVAPPAWTGMLAPAPITALPMPAAAADGGAAGEREPRARRDDPRRLRPADRARGRAEPPRRPRRRRRHRLDRRRRRPLGGRRAAAAAARRPGRHLPRHRRPARDQHGRVERRAALDLLHRRRPEARAGRRPRRRAARRARAHPLLRRRRARRPHADRRARPGDRGAALAAASPPPPPPPSGAPPPPPTCATPAPAAPPTSAAATSPAPPTPAPRPSPRSSAPSPELAR